MSKMAGLNRLVASSQGKRTESFTVLARKVHHEAPLLAKGQAAARSPGGRLASGAACRS